MPSTSGSKLAPLFMSSGYSTPYQSPSTSYHHPFCACLSEPHRVGLLNNESFVRSFKMILCQQAHLLKQQPQYSQSYIRKQNTWAPLQYRQAQMKYIVPQCFPGLLVLLVTWVGRTAGICSNRKSSGIKLNSSPFP